MNREWGEGQRCRGVPSPLASCWWDTQQEDEWEATAANILIDGLLCGSDRQTVAVQARNSASTAVETKVESQHPHFTTPPTQIYSTTLKSVPQK